MSLRVVAALILLLSTTAAVAADATTAGADLPRLPSGRPDLSGVWQVMSRANDGLLAHPARAARALREGPFGPVPAAEVVALGAVGAVPAGLGVVDGGEIPYLPGKEAVQQENAEDWLARDPEIKCWLPGVPRANYLPYPFQIFHGDERLFIAYEFAGATRDVPFEDPGEAPVDSWMGQSWGRWDGDVLVVEVTGQNASTWFDRTGHWHTEALKVTETWALQNAHVMEYTATIEDPNVYSRPWTIRMPVYRRVGADATLQQFKCVEFVEELLYGDLRKAPLDAERRSPLPE